MIPKRWDVPSAPGVAARVSAQVYGASVKPLHLRHLSPETEAADLDWVVEDAPPQKRAGRMLWWGVRPEMVRKAAVFAALVVTGALGVLWLLPSPEPVVVPEGFFDAPERLAPPVHGVDDSASPAESVLMYVHVAGEVLSPGLIRLVEGARVADALTSAGGPTAEANLSAINLAAHVNDGEQILVPALGDPAVPLPVAGSGIGGPGGPVRLNTASAAVLETLPGIGPVLAERIVSYRTANGPFASVDALQSVPGIGPKLMAALRDELAL